ncbi:hypothetical protein Afe04nite_56590 [Asanoa ferruginea]|uniref:hypothetical protein n=1 Tax=Asanoa ferruginea TaxID=53367 RepID=UPI0011C13AB7|nr:hypothetical protein [Asanoa ferruginea]GIF51120.1 hypothetical protein Afe04nite_56590 [Asanoa ferruginea]
MFAINPATIERVPIKDERPAADSAVGALKRDDRNRRNVAWARGIEPASSSVWKTSTDRVTDHETAARRLRDV